MGMSSNGNVQAAAAAARKRGRHGMQAQEAKKKTA